MFQGRRGVAGHKEQPSKVYFRSTVDGIIRYSLVPDGLWTSWLHIIAGDSHEVLTQIKNGRGCSVTELA